MNLHHAIRKGFHGTQFQRHLAMPWRDEWNAFPDEDRYNGDNEFVPTAEYGYKRPSGGRAWWAHFEFTLINITPTILHKKIEDL